MHNDIDLQPTLQGTRVIVRPIAVGDWDAMFAAASDPGIWALHPESDRYTEPAFRRFFDSALACGSAFTIIDRRSGDIIGSSRYHGHDPVAREIEIGWTFLSRAYWGGSYNLEVKRLMIDHALRIGNSIASLSAGNERRTLHPGAEAKSAGAVCSSSRRGMNCRLRRRLCLVVRSTVGDAEIAGPCGSPGRLFRRYPVPGDRRGERSRFWARADRGRRVSGSRVVSPRGSGV